MSSHARLGPKQNCPHCDAEMRCVRATRVSLLVRELIYQCTDIECACVLATQNVFVRVITQSLKPNPNVPFVPMARKRRWKKKPAPAASDEEPDGTPAD